jgi:dimethylargininase
LLPLKRDSLRAPSSSANPEADCFAARSKAFRVHFSLVLTAITREVSPAIVNCEVTFIARQPIALAKAEQQHRDYQRLLEKCGARVITLPAEPTLPDSIFVEDPAIVLDELAVILPLGTETRRAEALSIEYALSKFRKLARVELPGTAEGGDILRVGRRVFAGLSSRTNAEGIRQLGAILAPYGYEVISVEVTGCLHLKSAVTYIGRKPASGSQANSATLLANRAWFDTKPFTGCEWIDVDPDEAHAANALAIHDTVIFPASFPRTRERIEQRGFLVTPLDISELQKAESGLTCSSLLFEASTV